MEEVYINCYLVNTGKPTSCISIRDKDLESAKKIVELEGLNFHVDSLSGGWFSLWIYKYKHLLPVIKELPEHPITQFDHWVLGKAFGYDENSISEFIEQLVDFES